MTTTNMQTTDTIYISPYEIRRPRGRPKGSSAPAKPAPAKQAPAKQAPAKPSGRPKREVPLTPEEIIERRRRYKDDDFKKAYEQLYQQCYYQRPDVKQRKTENKRKQRAAERETRKSQ